MLPTTREEWENRTDFPHFKRKQIGQLFINSSNDGFEQRQFLEYETKAISLIFLYSSSPTRPARKIGKFAYEQFERIEKLHSYSRHSFALCLSAWPPRTVDS